MEIRHIPSCTYEYVRIDGCRFLTKKFLGQEIVKIVHEKCEGHDFAVIAAALTGSRTEIIGTLHRSQGKIKIKVDLSCIKRCRELVAIKVFWDCAEEYEVSSN